MKKLTMVFMLLCTHAVQASSASVYWLEKKQFEKHGGKMCEPIDVSSLDKNKIFQEFYNQRCKKQTTLANSEPMSYEMACKVLKERNLLIVELDGEDLYIDLRSSSLDPSLYNYVHGANAAENIIAALRKAAHDESATIKDALSGSAK